MGLWAYRNGGIPVVCPVYVSFFGALLLWSEAKQTFHQVSGGEFLPLTADGLPVSAAAPTASPEAELRRRLDAALLTLTAFVDTEAAHDRAHAALVQRNGEGAPEEEMRPLALEHLGAEVRRRDAYRALVALVEASRRAGG